MKMIKVKQRIFTNSYHIQCSNHINTESTPGISFLPTFCRILPGQASTSHQHIERELFLISHGRAVIIVEGIELNLEAGDQILFSAFEQHQIVNRSKAPLEFWSIFSAVEKANINIGATLIITAPPTPNGKLHLGHLSGPYLMADVLQRLLSIMGNVTDSMSGTDDFQSCCYLQAKKMNSTHQEIRKDLENFSMLPQYFNHPTTDQPYQSSIKKHFTQLIESPDVKQTNISLPYHNGHFFFEATLKGICPQCHSKTFSQCCEECGYVGEARTFNHKYPLKKSHLYQLNFSHHLDKIRLYHRRLKLNARIIDRLEPLLNKESAQFTLHYPTDMGISGIHAWVEMAFSMLRQRETFEVNRKIKLQNFIYCFGIDNAYYYLVLIPAIFISLGVEEQLPNQVIINDFLLYNGLKFSTSRQHAVWASDIAAGERDYLRLYLALNRSELSGSPGDFTTHSFDLFQLKMKDKCEKILSLSREQDIPINYNNKNFTSLYKKMVKLIQQLENDFLDDYQLKGYANYALKLIDLFEQVILSNSKCDISQLPHLVPLLKMVLHPLMPNLFPINRPLRWGYDLQEEK